MALSFDTEPTAVPRWSKSPLAAAAVVLLLGVALTLLLFTLVRDPEQDALQRKLDVIATRDAAAVQKELDYSLQVVDSLRRLYEASNAVTAREFRTFAEPVLAGHPYLQALEWAPRVVHGERGAFESAARAEGLTRFRITERDQDGKMVAAAERSEYFPLRHIVPLGGNEPALGFDIATQPQRTPILEAARAEGTAQVSNVFRPVQGADGRSAFVILSPVFRNGSPQATASKRRAVLKGYVIGLIRVGDLVKAGLDKRLPSGVHIALYDETAADAPVRVYFHRSRLQQGTDDAVIGSDLRQALALDIPGRRWVLRFQAAPQFLKNNYSRKPEFVLAGGLGFSLLSSLYVFGMLRRKNQIHQLADDLSRSNLELQTTSGRLTDLIAAAPMAVIALDTNERVTEWNPAAERMFGWRREEVLGLDPPMIDRSDPDSYRAIWQGEAVTNVEGVRRRRDGSTLPVRIAGAPLRDAAGRNTGMLAMMEDLGDLQHARREAQRRDAMLEAVNQVARLLLKAERWSPVMPEVLSALGKAAEVDRTFLVANHRAADGALQSSLVYAWTSKGIPSPGDINKVQNVPYPEGGLWAQTLARGEVLQGDVADFPEMERSFLESLGVASTLLVPIWVDDVWWGFIGFDTCHERREWGAEEMRLLRIAVEGLGAAIRRERYEQHLRQSALVFGHTVNSVIITDAEARILDVNPAFTEITGYSREEAIGQKPSLIKSDRHDRNFYRDLWSVLLRDGLWQGEIWDRRKNGEIFPAQLTISAVIGTEGDTTHYVGVLTDLTAIRETQNKLEHLANHDPLTDLPNQRLFAMQLEQAVRRAARADTRLALLSVNIDRLKDVNNSLGYAAGDALILQFTRRLATSLREIDQVGIGSGGWLVLLEGLSKAQRSAILAQKLLDALSEPFRIGKQDLFISSSIGISLYPIDGAEAESLMRNAGTAMHRAKEMGRGRFKFYTEDLTGRAHERVSLAAGLARALKEDQFQIYYQPQVDLHTGQPIGAEALLRWMHPEHGMVSPAKFIPLAEELGLIVPIGEWVLRTACATARSWCDDDSGFRRIAVNVAGPQLTSEFVDTVREVLADTGLPPACLELEVTEGFIMGQAEGGAIKLLERLKALGVELAIDDFGTGYSSLSYLKRLPIDKLKIDQSFVRGIPNPDDEAICRAVIALGKSLRLQVIAEGVETPGQRDFLKAENCNEGQGYLYSKPIPSPDFQMLLERGF